VNKMPEEEKRVQTTLKIAVRASITETEQLKVDIIRLAKKRNIFITDTETKRGYRRLT